MLNNGGMVDRAMKQPTERKRVLYDGIKPKETNEIRRWDGQGVPETITIVSVNDPTHPFNQHQLGFPNEHELTGKKKRARGGLRSDYGYDDWK
jgi:hypothetical protein